LQDFNAKISDFGCAKLGPSAGDSHVTTRIIGTYGYAAPEYIATGDYISFLHTHKLMHVERYEAVCLNGFVIEQVTFM